VILPAERVDPQKCAFWFSLGLEFSSHGLSHYSFLSTKFNKRINTKKKRSEE